MRTLIIGLFFIAAVLPPTQSRSEIRVNTAALTYCVPVHTIDLNPFRQIRDGKDLAYLMLLKSYISSEPGQEGLLSKYEFSPDGKTFTGYVNPNAKWIDGTPLTSSQAAEGIIRGFLFRPIGQRVSVVGASNDLKNRWNPQTVSGLKLPNDNLFEIKFASTIENVTGIVREALSTNSRHNRVWPIQSNSKNPSVIGKSSMLNTATQVSVLVKGESVLIAPNSKCRNFDFTLYPDSNDAETSEFEQSPSPEPQSITVELNTATLSLSNRHALGDWVRHAFSDPNLAPEFIPVNSFFLVNEAGHDPRMDSINVIHKQFIINKKIRLGYRIPSIGKALKAEVQKTKAPIELVDLTESEKDVDARVETSGLQHGRHILLQDLLETPLAIPYLRGAPKTMQALRQIQKKSAATVPPDATTLHDFEVAAVAEKSIVPVARRFIVITARRNRPVRLVWEKTGELSFVSKDAATR